MDTTSLPARIAQMAAITQMERGHLSVIRTSPDGQPYCNLQRRENGRNVTALQHLKKSLIQNLLTRRMRLSPAAIAELAERFEDEKVATRDRAATP